MIPFGSSYLKYASYQTRPPYIQVITRIDYDVNDNYHESRRHFNIHSPLPFLDFRLPTWLRSRCKHEGQNSGPWTHPMCDDNGVLWQSEVRRKGMVLRSRAV